MSRYEPDTSHPDEPPTKRRTLQIKLGRPRPPTDVQQAEQASPSLNRSRPGNGIRISLKRKASVSESHFAPPRFAVQHAEDDEDEEYDEQGDAHGQQRAASGDTSEDDDDGDDQSDGDEDQEDDDVGEDGNGDEDMQDGDGGPTGAHQDDTALLGRASTSVSALNGDTESNPRIRGRNGAFQSTGAGGSNPSRRPVKRLRSKGLYEALPKLVENLQRRDNYKFFCEPVNPDDVPGYTDVIKTPMDFGTMQSKVDDRLYSHMDDFKADFQLVVSNAMTFNPEGTLYYNEAKRIAAWGNRAIEREGMAVNDNGRAGAKGDEIKRQRRLAKEAAASSPANLLDPASIGGGPGRRQLRGGTLQPLQNLDGPSPQQSAVRQASLGVDADDPTRPFTALGSRFAFSAGVQALMEAARFTSQARQRAAIALGLTGGTLTREDSVQAGTEFEGEGDADQDVNDEDDDNDEDASDQEGGMLASVSRSKGKEARERSVTVDGVHDAIARRIGSTQPTGTPLTPMGQRQASPDALRKRLAAVTGTPVQALASPMGPGAASVGAIPKATKHAKHKQRLGAPGTPKRLLVRSNLPGSATPAAESSKEPSDLPLDATNAAAQLVAAMTQSQTQPIVANYSFEDDGSINPEDIDNLQTFLTLHRSGKQVLMPTIESLYPVPFIPGDYTSSDAGDRDKEQEKEKDRAKEHEKEKAKDNAAAAADDMDDDDEDGKGETREKGDKDPLSTLPPARPGAPDPLYSAIAPEPESVQSNLSHDVDPLPPHFRNLPFHVPSLPDKPGSQRRPFALPSSWINAAYVEALRNDKRPKKQKDKEREKERETLEDWGYFRPTLTRLLEITDLGPFSALAPHVQDDREAKRAKPLTKSKGARAARPGYPADLGTHEFSTVLLAEEGIRAIKAQLSERRQCAVWPREILKRYTAAAQAGDSRAADDLLSQAERQDASRIVSDKAYAGLTGQAYIRSVAEFVDGAMHHALLLDEVDDAVDQQSSEAEKQLLLAAAMRNVERTEETPEPTAASRRGPFMWRDTTEEVGGTATPAGPRDDEAEQQGAALTVDIVADDSTMTEADNTHSAISEMIKDLNQVEAQLAPLSKPLAQVVEEEVIRPITGDALDLLHLVAIHLGARGSDALDAEAVERRLSQNKAGPNNVETAAKTAVSAVSVTGSHLPPQQPQASLLRIPFAAEMDWLKEEPGLTQLLDEARMDVDSLGSILNYIVQSA